MLLDPQLGRTVRHNPARARTRFLPASTYGNVYFFAINIDIEANEDAAARLLITRAILRDLGLTAER